LVSTSFVNAEKYPDFCEQFTREIYRGTIGEDVKQLQIVLNSEGFKNVPVSGFFGYETAQAIRKIQTENGKYPFGKIGPDTYKLLKNLWCKYEPEPVIQTDMTMSIYPTSSVSDNVTVTWETKNAVSCTLNNSSVSLNDSKAFALSKKMKLTFACLDSKNQTVKKNIIINPGQSIGLPPELNASMDPSSLDIGSRATVSWLSVNTDSCIVDGIATTTKGTALFTAKTINPTLKIVCMGSGREVSKVLGAGVSGDPVGIKYFNSEKYGINLETECKNAPEQFSQKTNRIFGTQAKTDNPCLGNTYISWSTLGTKSCTMTGPGFKNKPASLIGGENINVKNFDNFYQLNCIKNDNQIVSKDLTVKGIYYERVLVSSNITSDKSSYLPGETANFVASIKNDTGKDLNYFTSFPCLESSPFQFC
jgi:peptidoglycan hydrolase-like protein with peptidoglycan-binding domain